MKINKVKLQNFRSFEHLELNLHPNMNVLVGVNGSGKTAVLEALKLGVAGIIGELKGAVPQKTIASGFALNPKSDPRISIFEQGEWVQSENLEIEITLDNSNVVSRKLQLVNTKYKAIDNFKEIKSVFGGLNEALQTNENVELPLFAYYSTGRLFMESNDTQLEMNGRRLDGYLNALTAKSSQKIFQKWFEKHEKAQYYYPKHGVKFDFIVFEKVKSIITEVMQEWEQIFYDGLRFNEIVLVMKDGTTMPYSFLSDGNRNLIALVSDLALRCAVLNPWLNERINSASGIVLIDEIDLHLHPGWQRKILPALARTFPNVQFIVTTHSPQVLASVSRESVFILNGTKVFRPSTDSLGVDSNTILTEVMQSTAMPSEVESKIEKLFEVLKSEEWMSAEEEIQKIVAQHISPEHPDLMRAKAIFQRKKMLAGS